jgi:hypothetical protein
LRAGSQKEEATRRFVDAKLLHISRRFVKKYQNLDEAEAEVKEEHSLKKEEAAGYRDFEEVARDLGEVIGVLWLSGTRELRLLYVLLLLSSSWIFGCWFGKLFHGLYFFILHISTGSRSIWQLSRLKIHRRVRWLANTVSETASLQIPYLLNVALSISSYLPAFPPSPSATFTLLSKMDHIFSSLLLGNDVESGETLPGFQSGRGVLSRTDMVRIKSLIEATRVQVVEVMGGGKGNTDAGAEDDTEMGEDTEMETDAETDGEKQSTWDGGEDDDEEEGHAMRMNVAKVYDRTLVQLGKSLSGDGVYDVGNG